ncbi:cytosine deaminase [Roseomonas sp. OT10]|uniref:cytosine deaminase n=1 Tax=Roseomonas cutis TaxID=2897332 RepID=UPI001E4F6AB0|nr:cytosine deaminase [Roseomonas sp. OT10]UFN49532.1 cytosine deaminase [Roseomonas sp. OT10]
MSGFPPLPADGTVLLHRAAVPACLLADVALARGADAEGLVLLDIGIAGGRIESLAPAAATAPEGAADLDAGQVWPCFVEAHAHLDKGHITPRAINADGTGLSAAAAVRADREANWSAADVRARFAFGLRCAYAQGTAAIRTHLDSQGPQAGISWPVFAELRAEWAGRIDLQAVGMVPVDTYATPEGEALARRIASAGGLLGGATRLPGATPAQLDAALDALFDLATQHGLEIDLHVDESGDPGAATLGPVARAALRHRFPYRVTCGHCCSLAVQEPAFASEVMDLVAQAGITIVSLPPVNLHLQGRSPGGTPRWRGVTLLHELKARGVNLLIGGDNCRDPFYRWGDHDMLETFTDAVRIGHLDLPVGDWPAAVTARPADWLRLPEHGRIAVGGVADLVLFRGRRMDELLSRRRGERVVLRAGRPIDTTLPDHRELDRLFAA